MNLVRINEWGNQRISNTIRISEYENLNFSTWYANNA